jgi:Pyruvate/2-oxoacid:ferredoxin oxidoreductase gamma subunit
LQDKKDRVFVVDCIQISLDTIGRSMPNTPVLGAFMKISGNSRYTQSYTLRQKYMQKHHSFFQ